MADETTQPEAAAAPDAPAAPQEPLAAPADPTVQPVPDAGTEPQAAPDPTPAPAPDAGPTPSTSSDTSEPSTGDTPAEREKATLGQFVDVISGEYAGLFGVYLSNIEVDEDGNPVTILFRNRDHGKNVDTVAVPHDAVTPSDRTGGR